MFRAVILTVVLHALSNAAAVAQDANATLMLICDLAAGSPGDKNLPFGVIGVRIDRIDARIGVPACEAASAAFPDQPRLGYQLGRAHHAMKAYDLARQTYLKAYEKGYKRASSNIGGLYAEGFGVPRDYQEARAWYQRGVDAGEGGAMDGMGWLYLKGEGVTIDYQEARRWFERAVDTGDAIAMGHLGWLHQQGLGVPINYYEARGWYERGAAGGDPFSMASLAYFLENGYGGSQDRDLACLWFKQAAELGNPSGKDSARALGCS